VPDERILAGTRLALAAWIVEIRAAAHPDPLLLTRMLPGAIWVGQLHRPPGLPAPEITALVSAVTTTSV
jgi:hypothetical protein